jgi:hypothetical protein
MSSLRQIEANRRNARLSTGPVTEAGKEKSRRNALRHGLTAETVIHALEDAADYAAFEMAVTADFDAQSAVERELVLRLASLLWRLRRVTGIEAGLFQEQARKLSHLRQLRQSRRSIGRDAGEEHHEQDHCDSVLGSSESSSGPDDPFDGLTQAFIRLTNLPSYPLDRLNRYEASLWRQACQLLFTLRCLDRRKPWEAWAQSRRR